MTDRGAKAMLQIADGAFEPARRAVHTTRPGLSEGSSTKTNCTYPSTSAIQISREIDDVDTARMEEYALLAVLLTRAPDGMLLKGLSAIRSGSTPLGLAHAALAREAEEASLERLEREFFDLFIGVGRGELLPYGSYYLTGFLNERPLARLRNDLRILGIARADDQTEPEDHAAILCEIMAGLAGGGFVAAQDTQKKLFERHLAPWIGRFFADLEQIKSSKFYRCVGTVGRLFVEIETNAFALP